MLAIVINYGKKQYLDRSENWSKHAMDLARFSPTIRGARGVILVELSQYNDGKEILLPLTEPENDTFDLAISSCYLAKADYYLGNIEKSQYWLKQANKLCLGQLILYNIYIRIAKELKF